jgi:hypothetical protein
MDAVTALIAVAAGLSRTHPAADAFFHVGQGPPKWAISRDLPISFDGIEKSYSKQSLDIFLRQMSAEEGQALKRQGVLQEHSPIATKNKGKDRSGVGMGTEAEPAMTAAVHCYEIPQRSAKAHPSTAGGETHRSCDSFSCSCLLAQGTSWANTPQAACGTYVNSLGVDLAVRNEAYALAAEASLLNLYGQFDVTDSPGQAYAARMSQARRANAGSEDSGESRSARISIR